MIDFLKLAFMSAFTGYIGNKLFGKNKTFERSIKWGCIIGGIVIILHELIISIKLK